MGGHFCLVTFKKAETRPGNRWNKLVFTTIVEDEMLSAERHVEIDGQIGIMEA